MSWFLVPLVFFSVAKTKMPGYIGFSAGAYFIIASLFVNYIYESRSMNASLKYLVLLMMIALPLRYSIERIKPHKENPRPQWVTELKRIEQVNPTNRIKVLFNFDEPIKAMFYTDMIVYDVYPTQRLIDSLSCNGYDIIVNQNEQLVGVRSINVRTQLND